MHVWLKDLLCGAGVAIAGAIGASIRKIWSRQRALEDGMLALMHDRIFSIYAECQRKGYATVEEIRNLEYLYKPYHNLGGNGTGTELYERVKKMPTEPPAQR